MKLIGEIALDGAGFERGLRRASEHVTDFVKNATIAAFGFYGVEEAIKKTVEAASELVNSAKRLDATVEQVQMLKEAAKEAGVDLNTMASAFEKINLARSKALGGDASALTAFARLGVSPDMLKNLNASSLFTGAISDSVKRNNVASLAPSLEAVMGRGFGELIPALKTDFDEVRDKLKRFGVMTDSVTAVKLKNMGDEFETISQIITAMLGPALVKMGEWVMDLISHSKIIESVDFLSKRNNLLSKTPDFVDSHGVSHGADIREQAASDMMSRVLKSMGKQGFDEFRNQWKFAFSGVFEDFKGSSFEEFSKYLGGLRTPAVDATQKAAQESGSDMSALQKSVEDWKEKMQKAADDLGKPKPGAPPTDEAGAKMHIPSDALVHVGNFLGSNGSTIERANQHKISLMQQQLSEMKGLRKDLSTHASFGTMGIPLGT